MFFFHSVGNNNPNWLIFFQRGRYTTNQYHMIERKYAIKLGDKTSFQRALGGGLARQSLVLATSPSLCSCACSTLRSRSDVGSCCCERFQKNRLELWSNIFQPGYEVDWSYIYIYIYIYNLIYIYIHRLYYIVYHIIYSNVMLYVHMCHPRLGLEMVQACRDHPRTGNGKPPQQSLVTRPLYWSVYMSLYQISRNYKDEHTILY